MDIGTIRYRGPGLLVYLGDLDPETAPKRQESNKRKMSLTRRWRQFR